MLSYDQVVSQDDGQLQGQGVINMKAKVNVKNQIKVMLKMEI